LRFPSFVLLSLKKIAQAVELRVPELLVPVEPIQRALQSFALEATVDDTAGLAPFDQSRILENSEMLHESRQRHSERLGQLAGRSIALPQPRQDGASRRIRESAENGAERVARIVNHMVEFMPAFRPLSIPSAALARPVHRRLARSRGRSLGQR
jgi:hypothetical protein